MGLIGSILGTAVGTVGGIVAGKKLNAGYNAQRDIFEKRMDDVRAHRDALYYRDPTQSAENQAAVTEARDLLGEQAKTAAASNAVAGGTDESAALAKKQGADTVGKMLQQQAVEGARQKEAVYDGAERQIDAFSQYLASSKLQQAKENAQAISKAAGGAGQALGKLPW